jgi:DNA repair exonuclease SbcCD nuclease subunit
MLRDGWAVNEPIEGYDLILLGHIHGHQSNYPGSPIQTDVGERNDNKGFEIIDTDTMERKFVELKSNLIYKLIELDHVPTKEELEKEYPITDHEIVVLRMTIKKEDNVNINLIKEYLDKANFYKIEIEYTDAIQTRQEGITEKIDPLTALITYIKADKNCQYMTEIIEEATKTFAEMNKH